jgi:hypothetical protein
MRNNSENEKAAPLSQKRPNEVSVSDTLGDPHEECKQKIRAARHVFELVMFLPHILRDDGYREMFRRLVNEVVVEIDEDGADHAQCNVRIREALALFDFVFALYDRLDGDFARNMLFAEAEYLFGWGGDDETS